jgi:glucose/arabinose dehydrogenase
MLASVVASAQEPSLAVRNVVTGLDTPWEILWGPDNRIWMTERYGRVSRVDPATGQVDPLLMIPDVYELGESGLLGMALHPDFPASPFVYLVYTYQDGGQIREKLVRYTYSGSALASPQVLVQDLKGNTTHDGSRLMIGPDRMLYVSAGDAQDQPAAQDHTSLNGKILRLNLDGTPPADNPWPDAPFPTNLLWSTGHRNPQGMVTANGIFYSSEHGPSNDDEVNIIMKGRNYGWPTVQGYCDLPAEQTFCNDSNVVEPIKAWTPTLAVAGIDYYDNPAIPAWSRSLLMVTLKEQDLRRLGLSADGRSIVSETVLYDNQFGRLRDICVAPDGRVFIATSNKDGRATGSFPKPEDDRIIELKAPSSGAPSISSVLVVTAGDIIAGDSVLVTFTTNGMFDSANTFTAQLSDSSGSFAAPMVLGSITARNSGSIQGVVSCDALEGTHYRVRVVASAPAASGENAVPLIVHAFRPTIEPGDTVVCAGSLVSLDAGPYASVKWSTGDETRMIVVSESGEYSATVTSAGGCTATTPKVRVTVAERPQPEITLSDGDGAEITLTASAGFTSYQWYKVFISTMGDDTVAIDSARGRTLRTGRGRYVVKVTDSNGCEGTRAVNVASTVSVDWEKPAMGLRVYPHPAHDRVTVEAALEQGAAVEIVITDMRGNDLVRLDDRVSGGTYRREISLDALPAGAYVLQLRAGERHWREKVVKE